MSPPLTDRELLEQIKASLDAHERYVDQGLVARASGPVLARRRRLAAFRVVAIAVAVLLLVAAVAVGQLHGRTAARPAGQGSTATSGSSTGATHADTVVQYANKAEVDMARLVQGLTPVPGATRHATLTAAAPVPGLDLGPLFVKRAVATTYWTAAGSASAVAAALTAHPAPGYRFVKAPTGAPSPAPGATVVLWAGKQMHPEWMWPVVELTITADGAGAAIRGDAMASIREVRAADTVLPADARLVGVHTLRVTASGEPVSADPVVTPELGAAVLTAFAGLGPSEGRFAPLPLWAHCDPLPLAIPEQTTYDFATAHGAWSVRSTGGCVGGVSVSNGVTTATQQLLPDAAWQRLEGGLPGSR